MEKKIKIKNFLEYLNTAGIAAFSALTLVQTVFAVSWLAKNIFAPKNGKEFYFHYKETGSFVLMAAVVFILTMTIVKKVVGSKAKFFCYGTIVLYVMTLPTVLSVNFNATLYAICISLLMLLIFFALRYFYGVHTRRLWCLIGIFALLVAKRVAPKTVVPMHYQTADLGFKLEPVDRFLAAAKGDPAPILIDIPPRG